MKPNGRKPVPAAASAATAPSPAAPTPPKPTPPAPTPPEVPSEADNASTEQATDTAPRDESIATVADEPVQARVLLAFDGHEPNDVIEVTPAFALANPELVDADEAAVDYALSLRD